MSHIKTLIAFSFTLLLTACGTDSGGSKTSSGDTTPPMGMGNFNVAARKSTMKPSPRAIPVKVMNRKPPKNFMASRVRIRKAPRLHLRNRVYHSGKMYVYFLTNSYTLYRNDLNDITSYAQAFDPNRTCRSFIIEGHADFRGPEDWNMKLSRDRAEGVKKVLLRNMLGCAKAKIATFGESKPLYKGKKLMALRKNRRVVVIPETKETSVIHRGLTKCPGDVYLLDMSASMTDYVGRKTKWQQVQEYKYPNSSKIFLFNTGVVRSNATWMQNNRPRGETAMFDAIFKVLQQMEEGKNLTVLTDGMDNSSSVSSWKINMLARNKKIRISVVGIGLHPYPRLTKMVTNTGGKLYLVR